jgi:hypothetical protein
MEGVLAGQEEARPDGSPTSLEYPRTERDSGGVLHTIELGRHAADIIAHGVHVLKHVRSIGAWGGLFVSGLIFLISETEPLDPYP